VAAMAVVTAAEEASEAEWVGAVGGDRRGGGRRRRRGRRREQEAKVPYDAIHNTAMLDPSHPDTNARCTAMMISPCKTRDSTRYLNP
jgi:hypothetical protein